MRYESLLNLILKNHKGRRLNTFDLFKVSLYCVAREHGHFTNYKFCA